MAELELRPLRPDDDRSTLDCGQPEMNRFFHHYAGQNQFRLHLARTWVAAFDGVIIGFATICAASIERANVPTDALRSRLPDYTLPVLRLARLAVDRRAQRIGVGHALLRHCLLLALRQRDEFGCIGVVTDAKPGAEAFYAALGFVPLLGVREGLLTSEPPPMFLSIRAVEAALGKS